ncbi:hypothetical protein C8R48DRAFT_763165 [Suillus tomentosus]|nr:hypothetical protein C8R48DRAFT_763165 [Suillus tomentosus]
MAGKGREMAKRHLSKCLVVCFVERSATNAEGMSEGSAPTMSDQNAIDPCECAASTIDHIWARESRQKNKGSEASARIARARLCSLGVHRLDQVNQSRRMGAAGHFPDTSVEGFIEAESAFQEIIHETMARASSVPSSDSGQVWGHQALSLWLPTGQMSGAQQERQAKVLGDREDVTEEVELA